MALGLAEGTVQTYVKRIYEKMGVSTKAEAALLAVARGKRVAHLTARVVHREKLQLEVGHPRRQQPARVGQLRKHDAPVVDRGAKDSREQPRLDERGKAQRQHQRAQRFGHRRDRRHVGLGPAAGTNYFMTFNPQDCQSPNGNATPNANFIGRSLVGSNFYGAIDSFRVAREVFKEQGI